MKGGNYMISKFFKLSLFVSSYIPVFIMIFLANLKDFSIKSIRNLWSTNSVFWEMLIVITIFSFFMIFSWLSFMKKEYKESSKEGIAIDNLELKDSEILNFFVTFIIPILSLKPNSSPSIIMNLILVIIEAIYVVSNNAVYYNVLLLLMGYHIYTFGDKKIMISKLKKSDIKFENRKPKQIGTTNIYYLRK